MKKDMKKNINKMDVAKKVLAILLVTMMILPVGISLIMSLM